MRARVLLVLGMIASCTDSSAPGWMGDQDHARSLGELSIPGTHDSGARFEFSPGLAKTQELTIAQQLDAGVRYLDIRCRHVGDAFLIYHGAVDQNQTYDEVLATLFAFLDEHPSEAIIASVKEEATPSGNTRSFEATFAAYLAQAPQRWHLDPAVPRLGEVRGQVVLLRRFSAMTTPLGIDAAPWPDNTTFTVANAASLRVQDAYMVADNSVKWAAITSLLGEVRTAPSSTLFLDYTSGYQTMNALPNITIVSDDINARLAGYLADPANMNARLGVLVMDFVTADLAAAIVATNVR
ncbi:MAG: phosphatidylinositol-specific phospholipase C [Deltaproteobacteria bacterium]|nr:phosphatidylinositol-specific phospholipase C [Deltaproteobacteria bacterium]